MADDKTPVRIGSSDRASGKHRWLNISAGIVVVAVLRVGTWQVVELHHEASDLQTQNQSQQARLESQQARLKNQQSQLDGLNSALGTTASGTTVTQLQSEISTIEGVTTHLGVRIGCVEQALDTATANPDGTLFVAIRGC
jgi:multidrug efflux pump subunit AcrA (membrane-fusion protein)